MRTIPRSSRSFRISSETLGMSRVISSAPSFVSRASTSCSSMWIEVRTSSLTKPLGEDDRVLVVVALPRHVGDHEVLAQRDLAGLGRGTVGDDLALHHLVAGVHDRLLVHVRALVRPAELDQVVDPQLAGATPSRRSGRPRRRRRRRSTRRPARRRRRPRRGTPRRCPRAAPRSAASGTACFCMFAPIRARFASSCSRNGISAAAHRDELLGRDVHVVDLGRRHRVDLAALAAHEDRVCRRSCRSSGRTACSPAR